MADDANESWHAYDIVYQGLYKSSSVLLKQAKNKKIMTYSVDFRAQVIKSVEQQGMSIRQACAFYDI